MCFTFRDPLVKGQGFPKGVPGDSGRSRGRCEAPLTPLLKEDENPTHFQVTELRSVFVSIAIVINDHKHSDLKYYESIVS